MDQARGFIHPHDWTLTFNGLGSWPFVYFLALMIIILLYDQFDCELDCFLLYNILQYSPFNYSLNSNPSGTRPHLYYYKNHHANRRNRTSSVPLTVRFFNVLFGFVWNFFFFLKKRLPEKIRRRGGAVYYFNFPKKNSKS